MQREEIPTTAVYTKLSAINDTHRSITDILQTSHKKYATVVVRTTHYDSNILDELKIACDIQNIFGKYFVKRNEI